MAGVSAQHCTGTTNLPNTIQCLGSDDIMPLGINSFAAGGAGTKNFSGNSRWDPGFTMGSWIRDGFLDSRFGLSLLADVRIFRSQQMLQNVKIE